jgi:hypothetical protein
MIENDKQLEITQTKLREFEETLAQLKKLPMPHDRNGQPDLELDIGALTGFIEEFKQDIAAYLEQTAL